ncbi:hypothetical protein AB0K00_56520 [Dactylosporangium sp. NPDC049525]|uniref:hypothetical protein n=1 Tax=Dactylosporangium sp. NPDC049525 TaxID=3154730 RepID=UPI00341D34DE
MTRIVVGMTAAALVMSSGDAPGEPVIGASSGKFDPARRNCYRRASGKVAVNHL